MKYVAKIIFLLTAILLGYSSYQNLMWAVWGKHNELYEQIAPLGSLVLLISIFIPLRKFRPGAPVALFGNAILGLYFVPAVITAFKQMITGNIKIGLIGWVFFILAITLFLMTFTLAVLVYDKKAK
ncbi:MAG: hypothetical protein IPJ07_17910 [Acidobacteria bacterium]|nr:hypothetical protein [Acidobacteriota bacterium]